MGGTVMTLGAVDAVQVTILVVAAIAAVSSIVAGVIGYRATKQIENVKWRRGVRRLVYRSLVAALTPRYEFIQRRAERTELLIAKAEGASEEEYDFTEQVAELARIYEEI
jgi:hypothetical protein